MRLAEAWHQRVLADPVGSLAFEGGFHPDHPRRLAAYRSEALGGPSVYTQLLGSESSVVHMHSRNGPHTELDRRAVACFDQALTDAEYIQEPVRPAFHDYFLWATSNLTRYPDSPDEVPDTLGLPVWTWDGLTSGLIGPGLAEVVQVEHRAVRVMRRIRNWTGARRHTAAPVIPRSAS